MHTYIVRAYRKLFTELGNTNLLRGRINTVSISVSGIEVKLTNKKKTELWFSDYINSRERINQTFIININPILTTQLKVDTGNWILSILRSASASFTLMFLTFDLRYHRFGTIRPKLDVTEYSLRNSEGVIKKKYLKY